MTIGLALRPHDASGAVPQATPFGIAVVSLTSGIWGYTLQEVVCAKGRAMSIVLLVGALVSTAAAGPFESAIHGEKEPVLLRAAQVLAMVIVCQEEQPAVAAHVDEAYDSWLERNPNIWEAMHALHFGPDPERLQVKRKAFDQLQEELSAERRRELRNDPVAFGERCNEFTKELQSGALDD